jgi:hypothetical protein
MFEGITDIARTHVYGDHSLTVGNIATTMIALAIMWFQPFGKMISVALAVVIALVGMALF